MPIAAFLICIEQYHTTQSRMQLRASCTVQGRLLQLRLPCEVQPDSSKAERSAATGHLLLTMPKEDASASAAILASAR